MPIPRLLPRSEQSEDEKKEKGERIGKRKKPRFQGSKKDRVFGRQFAERRRVRIKFLDDALTLVINAVFPFLPFISKNSLFDLSESNDIDKWGLWSIPATFIGWFVLTWFCDLPHVSILMGHVFLFIGWLGGAISVSTFSVGLAFGLVAVVWFACWFINHTYREHRKVENVRDA